MKRLIILFFIAAILFSCSSKDAVPGIILPPEMMSEVLWDVMRVQFLSEEMANSDTSVNKEEELKILTEKVFEIHKTTQVKFEKSYDWYIEHPELLKSIFDSIQVQKQREQNAPELMEDSHNPIPIKERLMRKEEELMREVE